jgi:hypothetical protein
LHAVGPRLAGVFGQLPTILALDAAKGVHPESGGRAGVVLRARSAARSACCPSAVLRPILRSKR